MNKRHFNPGRAAMGILCLALLLSALSAEAAPYEFVAIYKEASGTATKELVLKADAVIPDGAEGWVLSGVKMRARKTAADAVSLLAMRRIRTVVTQGKTASGESQLSADTQTETDVLTWTGADEPTLLAVPVDMAIHIRLSTELLCGQETLTRSLQGRPRCDPASKKAGDTCDPGSTAFLGAPGAPSRVLHSEGTRGGEILFSFCDTLHEARKKSGVRVMHSLDWDALATKVMGTDMKAEDRYDSTLGQQVSNKDALVEVHKRKLFEAMRPLMEEALGTTGQPHIESFSEGSEIVITDKFRFTVVRTGTLFKAVEISNETEYPLPSIVDQESPIQLRAAEGIERNLPCEKIFGRPFMFRFESTDDKGKAVQQKLGLEFGSGCQRFAKVSLKDYLDRSAFMAVYYPLDDGTEFRVWKSNDFTIRHLGLITTFPLVSELIAAAQGTLARDPAATSSIPISWAMRVGEDSSAKFTAVTFPWKLSVNTRKYPRLSKYLSVYPHASLIVPLSGDSETQPVLAVGAGISVAEVFHISYAWTPKPQTPGRSDFILVGLSIQDIVKLTQ